jgi:DNA transformation protein and related proteins
MTRNSRPPTSKLADLPSLGPKSAQMLAETGVTDLAMLAALGPIACFRSLRFRFGRRVTLNFLYALECAIRGLDWRLLEPERKAELRAAARGVIAELELSPLRAGGDQGEGSRSRTPSPAPSRKTRG